MNRRKFLLALITAAGITTLVSAGVFWIERAQLWPRRPGSDFFIPKDELDAVVVSANSGDLSAIRRLIYYFEQYEGDFNKAKYWSGRARAYGDEKELKLYAFELLNQSKYYAKDPEQKKKLLAEALVIAERLASSNRTAETEQLVQQIKAEQRR